jgi:hypothetical protein
MATTSHNLTPDGLAAIGADLYGPGWRSPLARALGLHRVTVSRYASGVDPIPVVVAWAVHGLAVEARRVRAGPGAGIPA